MHPKQLVILFGSFSLAACTSSMMTSYPVTSTTSARSDPLYGEYGLARTMLTVTVSEAGGAGAAGGSKDGTGVTNTVTITNTAAPATAATAGSKTKEPPPSPKNEAEWCTALRSSYNADRVATLIFLQERNVFIAKLNTWIGGGMPAAERAGAIQVIEKFVASLKLEAEAKQRAFANLNLVTDRCPQRLKVELKEAVEADPTRTFRLYGKQDAFSSDHVTTEFEGGLLKTVSATGDSQASQVIVALAKTVALFAMPGLPPAAGAPVGAIDTGALDKIVAAIRKQGPTTNLLTQLSSQIPDPSGDLPEIDTPLPFQSTLALNDLESGPWVVREGLPLVIRTDCSAPPELKGGSGALDSSSSTEGVFVSAERVCTFEVPDTPDFEKAKLKAFTRAVPLLARATVVASDSRYSYRLPVERTAFVKRSSNYTFANGRLAKTDFDHPSTAVEVISLPIKVVGAFVGGIAEGIRGRQGAIQAETDRIKAETARIQAATEYHSAKKAANAPAPEQEP